MAEIDGTDRETPEESGRRGGLARREKLTPARRKEIASKAALAKWSGVALAKLPKATHTGPLQIGGATFSCAVLDNGQRVLTHDAFLAALGRVGRPTRGPRAEGEGEGFETPVFLSAKNLKPYVSEDLIRASTPVRFQAKSGGNFQTKEKEDGLQGPGIASGYQAELLSDVCWVFINAQIDGKLTKNQEHIAERCKMLVRAFGKLGIVALVDEATGYQADRERDELRRILEQYVAEEMRRWVKTFPAEFLKQVYRLHGWTYKPGDTKTPRYVGKFIDRYIYKPMPPGVREELRDRNPSVNGQRKHKHFMFLTEDTGVDHLTEQIRAVTLLMKGAENKREFERSFARVFPAPVDPQQIPLFGQEDMEGRGQFVAVDE